VADVTGVETIARRAAQHASSDLTTSFSHLFELTRAQHQL